MMQSLRRRILAAALLTMMAAPIAAQQPPSLPFQQSAPQPFIWWKSEAFKKELGLSAEQITKIDKVWETNRAELRQEWEELSRLEEKFSRMLQNNNADEAILSRQIDRVEMARANANKTRSLMLVQMRLVLTVEQRVRLDQIHARWMKDQQSQGPAMAPPAPTTRDSQKKPEE